MNLINLLLPLNKCFKKDSIKQKKYINRFKTQESYFDRSYCQYKCQRYFFGYGRFIFLNILSIFLNFILIFKKNIIVKNKKKADGVFFDGKPNNILPYKYYIQQIENVNINKYYLFDENVRVFLKKISLKFKLRPYFYFKAKNKISCLNGLIKTFDCDVFISSSEYSFVSSLMTLFAEKNGCMLVNVMHGEKIFDIASSFNRYSEYYVWDPHYLDILKETKVYMETVKVELPYILLNDIKKAPCVDFIYYLQNQTRKEAKLILNKLRYLKKQNYIVMVRYHPLFKNRKLMKIFHEIAIDDSENIFLSLEKTKVVISQFSSVLFQGYVCKKQICIDDISNPKFYNKLKKLQYIMIQKADKLLSDI